MGPVLVFAIAIAQGGLTPLRLVLTGTVLASVFSAVAAATRVPRKRARHVFAGPRA